MGFREKSLNIFLKICMKESSVEFEKKKPWKNLERIPGKIYEGPRCILSNLSEHIKQFFRLQDFINFFKIAFTLFRKIIMNQGKLSWFWILCVTKNWCKTLSFINSKVVFCHLHPFTSSSLIWEVASNIKRGFSEQVPWRNTCRNSLRILW